MVDRARVRTTEPPPTCETLQQLAAKLHGALQAWSKSQRAGSEGEKVNASVAYKEDENVRNFADKMFERLEQITRSVLKSVRVKNSLPVLRNRLDHSDLTFVGNYGQPEEFGKYGGLMGAILMIDSSRSDEEIEAFCRSRVRGEIFDYVRFVLGRGKDGSGAKIHGAMRLSELRTSGGDGDWSHGAHMPERPSDGWQPMELTETVLTQVLAELDSESTTLIRERLAGLRRQHAQKFENSDVPREFSRKQTANEKEALLKFKLAYVSKLPDELLPDNVVELRDRIKKRNLSTSDRARAVYELCDLVNITQAEVAKICSLAASRISQIRNSSGPTLPTGLLAALGFNDLETARRGK